MAAALLDAGELIAAAQQATGLSALGEVDPRESLQLLAHSLNTEANLSESGMAGKRASLVRVLCNRLLLHDAFVRNPRLADEVIAKPMVILGLPRSGTTKLQRMIAADPGMQKLPLWRLMYPVRALSNGPGTDVEQRIAATEQFVEVIKQRAPAMYAAHPMLPLEPDEEYFAMELSFQAHINTSSFHTPTYEAWLSAQNFDNWYVWLKKLLQYVQFEQRGAGKPWILKAPHHLGYLPLLFKYFPDATILHCHRHVAEIVPSFCALIHASRVSTSVQADPAATGRYTLRSYTHRMQAYLRDRPTAEAQHAFVDIPYQDIVRDAPLVVRRCYEAAGIPLTHAAIAAMQQWEAGNEQHKHGQHRYQLADFGLAETEVTNAFSMYSARFAAYLR
jgi:hypothetical protein